ncbi:MAG: hypothetical protein F6K10_41680 [Moorea sp. SIO2B7]|nr:hypothetical protein [Moorena sp. SIO2B7]
MSFEKLQPAPKGDVAVYTPYYAKNKNKLHLLPYAISLYKKGSLEGNRNIEGSENIPFVASWHVSNLPADLNRCRVQFNGEAELSYEVIMSNHQFVEFLIEVIQNFKRHRIIDFSQTFYRKLIGVDK